MQLDSDDAQELAELIRLRDTLSERIIRLRRRTSQDDRQYNGHRKTSVPSEAIAPYVREWIDQGHMLRDLADKAGLSEETIRNILRPGRYVTETTVDKVLTALNVNHVYGRLVPEPPPTKYYEE